MTLQSWLAKRARNSNSNKPGRRPLRLACHSTTSNESVESQEDPRSVDVEEPTTKQSKSIVTSDGYTPYNTVKLFPQLPTGKPRITSSQLADDDNDDDSAEVEQNNQNELTRQQQQQCPGGSVQTRRASTEPAKEEPIYAQSTKTKAVLLQRRKRPLGICSDDFEISSVLDGSSAEEGKDEEDYFCRLAVLSPTDTSTERQPVVPVRHTTTTTTTTPTTTLTTTTIPAKCKPDPPPRRRPTIKPKPRPKPQTKPQVFPKPTKRGIIVDSRVPQPYSVVLLPSKEQPASPSSPAITDEHRQRLDSAESPLSPKLLYDQLVTFADATTGERVCVEDLVYSEIPESVASGCETPEEVTGMDESPCFQPSTLTRNLSTGSPAGSLKTRTTLHSTARRRLIRCEASREEYISMDSLGSQSTLSDTASSSLHKDSITSCPPTYSIPPNRPLGQSGRCYSSVQDLMSGCRRGANTACTTPPVVIRRNCYESIAQSTDSGVSDWSQPTTPDSDSCYASMGFAAGDDHYSIPPPPIRARSSSIKSLPTAVSRATTADRCSTAALLRSGEVPSPSRQSVLVVTQDGKLSPEVNCGQPLRRTLAKECLLASTIRVSSAEKSTIF